MSSDVEICNLALSHIGTGKTIASLDERSSEALTCKRFYETARKAMLRDFPWPLATKFMALGLVTESGDSAHPSDEWEFSYRLPSDCLYARRIPSGQRIDTPATRVPYKRSYDVGGGLILTDKQDAILEYTYNATDPSKFSEDMILAFSYRLAVYIVPTQSKGDPFKIKRDLMVLYRHELGMAQATAFNEEGADEQPESEFERARW